MQSCTESSCSVNKQIDTTFIYKAINLCTIIKLCINNLDYLKYLYKNIKIFVFIF